jgi:glycosyltransferase involved in cell wall biosynthesis
VVAPQRELHSGVEILRCAGTRLNKDVTLFKVLNAITLSLSIFLSQLRRFRRDDCVVVVTNPPILPFFTAIAARFRGARSILVIHDVYPDALVVGGLANERSGMVKMLAWLSRQLYRTVDRIVVVGRDMQELISQRVGRREGQVVCVPNWGEVDGVTPAPREQSALLGALGLRDKFVVLYAGNLGRPHAIERVCEAMKTLGMQGSDIHFLFVGSGRKLAYLTEFIAREGLHNVTVIGGRPRSEQQDFLNACDVALIPFVPGMYGLGVPSRMYNTLAAGKPIIAAVDRDSEIGRVIRENNVGWVARVDHVDSLVECVLEAKANPARLREMGMRGRMAVEEQFTLLHATRSYRQLLDELWPRN